MSICGSTIVRNAARLGYPFEESIRSLLPLVAELVVAVGRGEHKDDDTWDRVEAIRAGDARVTPFLTDWPAPRGGGDVLSQQTNLALDRCRGDWAIYLQADEVLHEDDVDLVRGSMRDHLRRSTEGLVFEYLHFWKSYGLVSDDWANFYPRAVRAVKPGIGIISAGDAAGFLRRRHGRTRGLLKAREPSELFPLGRRAEVRAGRDPERRARAVGVRRLDVPVLLRRVGTRFRARSPRRVPARADRAAPRAG